MRRGRIGAPFGAGHFLAVAHRGDWAGNRENTLPAVAGAIRAGADVVEVDVKTTADGGVVVLHDNTLDRLWGDPRPVTECTAAELTALGGGGHQIPTLDATLALAGGTGTALMIDMDADRWAEPAWRVVHRAVHDAVLSAPEILWCGRPSSLQVVRDLDPEARIVLSWDESDGLKDGREMGAMPTDAVVDSLKPEAVNPHWPMISADTSAWAEERGLALCCWTVDDEKRMRGLIRLGVQAMITNRIRTLTEVLDELEGGPR